MLSPLLDIVSICSLPANANVDVKLVGSFGFGFEVVLVLWQKLSIGAGGIMSDDV